MDTEHPDQLPQFSRTGFVGPHGPLIPFDAYEQPEHYAAWRASFERALLVRSTREVSA